MTGTGRQTLALYSGLSVATRLHVRVRWDIHRRRNVS